jgi:hypothetical protein
MPQQRPFTILEEEEEKEEGEEDLSALSIDFLWKLNSYPKDTYEDSN